MNKRWIVIVLCLFWISCRNPISTKDKSAMQDSIMVPHISQDTIIQKSIECKDSNFLCFSLGKYKMYLGEIYSAGEGINEDFNISYKGDSIFVKPTFLESDSFDNKQLLFKPNLTTYQLSVKYYLSYLFNGDEKAQQYIDLGYILPIDLKSTAKIPAFKSIKNDRKFESFLQRNSTSIKKKLYKHYLNYYSQIPEKELQKCCPSDYKQYRALKSKGFTQNITTDDLGMYLDYSRLIIDIVINGQKYVIVFDKQKEIISEHDNKLLRNSILKELYARGVVTVENDSVKVVIPFDVHGADCGAPDCYTTTVRFAFPVHNKVVLPKSLPFEEEETGCVEPYRLTDVFQLQEQTPDYVIYYAPKHKRTLLIFKNRSMQSTNAFYCLGLAAGRIHRKNVYRVYEDYFLKENKDYQVYMLSF